MELRKFHFFLSGVKESRRRRENFQDLALDLKEKPLKIAFLMLKTSKIFACGAVDFPTVNAKSQNPVYQSSPLALKCLTVMTTSFKVPSVETNSTEMLTY